MKNGGFVYAIVFCLNLLLKLENISSMPKNADINFRFFKQKRGIVDEQ
jgi:hypothetical protein